MGKEVAPLGEVCQDRLDQAGRLEEHLEVEVRVILSTVERKSPGLLVFSCGCCLGFLGSSQSQLTWEVALFVWWIGVVWEDQILEVP